MKNSKLSKTVTFSFLFLATNFYILVSSLIAQTSSTSLGNTIWKGPEIPYDIGTGPSILQEFFLFQKDGKVIQRSVVVQQSQLKSVPNMFNPLFNPFPNAYRQDGNNYSTPYDPYNPNNPYASTTSVTPRLEFEAFDNGTYEVNGKTLTIRLVGTCNNCSPSSLVATINGNKIEGELFLGGKKGKWAVEKMADVAGEVSTNSNPNNASLKSNEIRASNLIGTWEGTFAGDPCVLKIDDVDGTSFYGTLIQNGWRVKIVGQIDPNKRTISFTETEVISLGNSNQRWILGKNNGVFWSSNNISGTGVAEAILYQWNLTKK